MRRLTLFFIAAAALQVLALPAGATAGTPRLYAVTRFAVKPVGIGNITGDGSAFLGHIRGRSGAIRWSAWKTSGAEGTGKIWIDDCIPTTAQGIFHSHRAHVHASRVRNGHFTRMTVRYRGGSQLWNAGTRLYVDRYRLAHYSGHYFTWLSF